MPRTPKSIAMIYEAEEGEYHDLTAIGAGIGLPAGTAPGSLGKLVLKMLRAAYIDKGKPRYTAPLVLETVEKLSDKAVERDRRLAEMGKRK